MNKFVKLIVTAVLCCASMSLYAQATVPSAEHTIEVMLTPASGQIEISDKVRIEGRENYVFRLAPWLDIESVSLDDHPLRVTSLGHDYVVALPDRNPHVIGFTLRGRIPARGAQELSTAMLGSSGSDGVYLPGYDAWIPQHDAGPIRYRITVKLPPDQRAVVTGKLVSEQLSDALYQATFEVTHSGEVPSLFAGPYQVKERRSQGLRLRTYFHAELADLADVYLDAADAYIQRYQASIGAYPYADFHVISAPLPVGLGFPNLTYVGRQVIPLPFMRTRSLAHEVLHNWWGNGITVDYASGNWAEGLTTYMADYALERDKGEAEARSMRVKWLRDYAALPAQRDQPVRAFKSKQHQASQVIGYNKVAFIFHMLANEIGQPAFADGLQRFWSEHVYGQAAWRDLQAAFEQAAGRDLDWFFKQWLERSGAPRLSLGAHSVEMVATGYRTRVEILQPVKGYRFKLPLLLDTADGTQLHELTVTDTLTRVEFVTPAKPRYLSVDPGSDVFRRLQQDETPPILRDVTLNPSVSTVVASADDEFVEVARNLAVRLMDVEPRFDSLSVLQDSDQALLLIASRDDLAGQLAQLKLEQSPELPDMAHSAAAWTARRANGAPVLVVTAENAAELASLLRPLPHYGGQSYVLFAAGRAVSRGIWPLTRGSLYLDLQDSL
ncbi:MAG: M1 family aminopeptidase [Gammaproteobacteria bacterium]